MDYKEKDKKQLATDFVKSRYSIGRFLATCDAEMRKVDVAVFIEWVKDLAISRGEDADFHEGQCKKLQEVISKLDEQRAKCSTEIIDYKLKNDNLNYEIERLYLKVNKLAEDNAKLASDGIKVTNKLADMSERNRVLQSDYEKLKNQLDQMYDTMCRNKQNLIVDNADDIVLNSELLADNKRLKINNENLISANQKLQSVYNAKLNNAYAENQSLQSEIEELKSISGHRENMQFIAICEKIVDDAKELQQHMEKDNVYNESI